jgi:ATP-dependent helicase/nuclease subunit A
MISNWKSVNELTLKDTADRRAAINNFGESTFIEAGAGTGKTETIAKRIISRVCAVDSDVNIEHVAAITFTERAGAELRARIGRILRESLASTPSKLAEIFENDISPSRIKAALANIDAANIGTIHSFALRLLQRFPVQAGLPLAVSMLDSAEQSNQMVDLANQSITDFFDDLSNRDLDYLLDANVRTSDIRKLLVSIQQLWLNIPNSAVESLKLRNPEKELDRFTREFRGWYPSALATFSKKKPTSEDAPNFFITAGHVDELLRVGVTEDSVAKLTKLISVLAQNPNTSSEIKDFRKAVLGSESGLKPAISRVPLVDWQAHNLIVNLVKAFSVEIDNALKLRANVGHLSFDDLLLLARNMVIDPDNAQVVRHIQDELRLFVVDEFQDTDLTQWELIRALASADSLNKPSPGRLVVVGDPKQSIYRFRGADVETYSAVREEFSDLTNAHRRQLSVNFRSNEHVVSFVNEVFAHETLKMTSINYQPISANVPENLVGGDISHFVRVIPSSLTNEEEAHIVSSYCRRVIDESWEIREDKKPNRVAKFGDIAILIPTRTSQHDLLESLFYLNVPIRTFDSAIVYERPLVRGLVDAARVLAGSDNELDLWFMLKSPLFGFTDDELLEYRTAGGVWDLRGYSSAADYANTPVGLALNDFVALGREVGSARPYEVLNRIVAITETLESHAALDRGYFEIDCVQLFLHHAKSWQSTSSGGIRDYVDWVNTYLDDDSFERLSHPDPKHVDAVEISTIHGVKGLEFPVVFVAGLGNLYQHKPKPVLVHPAGPQLAKSIEFKIQNIETVGHKVTHAKLESDADLRERMRVLYVAATRARDYLVFSNVSRERGGSYWAKITNEAVTAAVEKLSVGIADEFGSAELVPDFNPVACSTPVPVGFDDVLSKVATDSRRQWVINPSSAGREPSANAEPVMTLVKEDFDEAAFVSEGVTEEAAFGVAFHKAMELIVNARPHGLNLDAEEFVKRAMMEVEYSKDFDEIVSRVRTALDHPLVVEALGAEKVWTEINVRGIVTNPDGSSNLVVGTADLVYLAGEVLTVVDYKTGAPTEKSAAAYTAQLALYKQLFASATELTEIKCVILHVGSNGTQVH